MQVGINHNLDWYVVRTQPKTEYQTANRLRKLGYAVYLPSRRVERKNKRTHTFSTKEQALMTGYLFLGASRSLYYAAKCYGVVGVLSNEGYTGPPVRVPSRSIEAIYLAEVDMMFDDTRIARIHRKEEAKTRRLTVAMHFTEGQQCRVISGPFASFTGVVDKVTHQGQVELLVELFGRATTAFFDPSELTHGDKIPKSAKDVEYIPARC